MSEERLIRQCAPTLAGIKTGSLFPCPYETREELMADVRAFNRRFAARGLCLLPLRLENGHALLYLYRPAELRRDLQNGLAREILSSAGYRCGSCEGCVTDLVRRLRGSAEFQARGTLEGLRRRGAGRGIIPKIQKMYADLLRTLAVRVKDGRAGRRGLR